MKKRIILHIDMDAFFPSIEERENPQFKGKPIVVGSDPKEGKGRGVVSSASYEARKFGIRSAMPISIAWQKCPNAIFLPVNMELYKKVSDKIVEILKNYSRKIERASIDEAYLDISFCENYKKALLLAKEIKKEIKNKEKLNCTIGIGPNKLIAKIASGIAKPNGLMAVEPRKVQNFLNHLEITEIPGIGPKSAEKIKNYILKKESYCATESDKTGKEIKNRERKILVKDVKNLSIKELTSLFGKTGRKIYKKIRGIDEEKIITKRQIKSIGGEYTFEKDTRDPEIIFRKFDDIIDKVWKELKTKKFLCATMSVLCRFSTPYFLKGREGFQKKSKSKTFKTPPQTKSVFKKEAKKLLLKFIIENQELIRLIGLRCKVKKAKNN